MGERVKKRTVVIRKRATTATLEEPFWKALREIASLRKIRMTALVAEVDAVKGGNSLSSALRLYVLAHYQTQAAR